MFDNLHDTAFMGSGLSRTVFGTKDTVAAVTKDDIAAFTKTYFTGSRVVVAGAGAVNQGEVRTAWFAFLHQEFSF